VLPDTEDSAPVHTVTDPAETSPVSKVSSGKPGAAASNALAELNVIEVAPAGTATAANEMAMSAATNDLRAERRWSCRISMVCLLEAELAATGGLSSL